MKAIKILFFSVAMLFVGTVMAQDANACEPDCIEKSTSTWFDFDGVVTTDVISAADGSDSSFSDSASMGGLQIYRDAGGDVDGGMWANGNFDNGGYSSDDTGNGAVASNFGAISLSGHLNSGEHQHDSQCGHLVSGQFDVLGATEGIAVGMGNGSSSSVEGGGAASVYQPIGGPTSGHIDLWNNASAVGWDSQSGGAPSVSGAATLTTVEAEFDASTWQQTPGDD